VLVEMVDVPSHSVLAAECTEDVSARREAVLTKCSRCLVGSHVLLFGLSTTLQLWREGSHSSAFCYWRLDRGP
jgi:hypothetical protein